MDKTLSQESHFTEITIHTPDVKALTYTVTMHRSGRSVDNLTSIVRGFGAQFSKMDRVSRQKVNNDRLDPCYKPNGSDRPI